MTSIAILDMVQACVWGFAALMLWHVACQKHLRWARWFAAGCMLNTAYLTVATVISILGWNHDTLVYPRIMFGMLRSTCIVVGAALLYAHREARV